MTEAQSGLRFDIYERVHLAEDSAGIRELDELELVPDIQAQIEGDQVLLKGHLYLTGGYEGDAGEGKRTLEHLIPVEITLPLNRIQDVNQIAVDIEHFDVDLLSTRSLNLTGILTLSGIEMLSVPEESWREEEETVFVHDAAAGFGDITSQKTEGVETREAVNAPVSFAEQQPSPQSTTDSSRSAEELEATAPPELSDTLEQPDASVYPLIPSVEATEALDTFGGVSEVFVEANQLDEIQLSESAQDETGNLKIAFGSKQSSEETSYHLKSLIHTKEYRLQPQAEPEQEPEAVPSTDSLEWKRLFNGLQEEQENFSRVRICIVQKEDTLDTIAEKYSIHPREIQLYNRLSDEEISEGKALFIPK